MISKKREETGLDIPQEWVVQFVGRHPERERIKTVLKKGNHRLVQICGPPMTGKAFLAKQIANELLQESKERGHRITSHVISCQNVDSWKALVEASLPISDGIHEELTPMSAARHMCRGDTLANVTPDHLFVFTKCDDLISNRNERDKFLDLCYALIDVSDDTYVIVTCQPRLTLSLSINTHYCSLSVLLNEEAELLLQRAAPDVDLTGYCSDIARGCHCLPLPLLYAGRILTQFSGRISPSDMCKILKSPCTAIKLLSSKFTTSDCDIPHLMEKLLSKIPKHMAKDAVNLSLLKGSFSEDSAKCVLGHKNVMDTKLVLMTLSDVSALTFDHTQGRFSMAPFLNVYLSSGLASVNSDDFGRLRFVKFFGEMLMKAGRELFLVPMNRVYGYLHGDWDNLEQLLLEAIHCTTDSFRCYMEVVSEVEELLPICFPETARDFYLHLLEAAKVLGTPQDEAILKSFAALAMIATKVDSNTQEALRLCKEAYLYLEDSTSPYQLLLLKWQIGVIYFRQGKFKKCIRYMQDALKSPVTDKDKQKAEMRTISVYSRMALAEVFLGNYKDAEHILYDTIGNADRNVSHHNEIPIMLNSLGLIYERSGLDDQRALQFYMTSLSRRRMYAEKQPEILVVPINNTAMQFCKIGKHAYALKLLQEALDIREKCGWYDYNTALTLWHIGQIQMKMKRVDAALCHIQQAFNIFSRCTPKHHVLTEVRLSLCHCFLAIGDYDEACRLLRESEQFLSHYRDDRPDCTHVASTLLHLLYLSDDNTWDGIYSQLQSELQRLCQISREHGTTERYILLQRQISSNRMLFLNRYSSPEDRGSRASISEFCKVCVYHDIDLSQLASACEAERLSM